MRKVILALSFGALLLSMFSCAKIKERRLIGSWDLVRWYIDNDTSQTDILQTYNHLFAADEIRVRFFKNNELQVETYDNGAELSTESGTWADTDKFDYLTFIDTVSIFTPNVLYKVEQLTRADLVLRGEFTILNTTYPNVVWEFKPR